MISIPLGSKETSKPSKTIQKTTEATQPSDHSGTGIHRLRREDRKPDDGGTKRRRSLWPGSSKYWNPWVLRKLNSPNEPSDCGRWIGSTFDRTLLGCTCQESKWFIYNPYATGIQWNTCMHTDRQVYIHYIRYSLSIYIYYKELYRCF